MRYLKYALILGLLAATLTGCCCPLEMLFGETEFTTGDFSDAPAYPGSTQSTETNEAIDLLTGFSSIVSSEAEWKHYTTGDSESDVLDWYKDRLPTYGWEEASAEQVGTQSENTLVFTNEDEPNMMLVVIAVSGIDETDDTHIIIGRLTINMGED